MRPVNLNPPTGDDAREIANQRGPVNEIELRNFATWMRTPAALEAGYTHHLVWAHRLELLADVVESLDDVVQARAGTLGRNRLKIKSLQSLVAELSSEGAELMRVNAELQAEIDAKDALIATLQEGSTVVFAFTHDVIGVDAEQAQEIALAYAEAGIEVAHEADDEPKTLESVLTDLASKGDADAIAKYLEEQGIKGKRFRACDCPVANYLKRELDLDTAANVVTTGEYKSFVGEFSTNNPAPVANFIRTFDNAEARTAGYPQLDADYVPPKTDPKTDREKLADALEELASKGGPDEIAAFLQSAGIKGITHEPCDCPVANFVKTRGLPHPAHMHSKTATVAIRFGGSGEEVPAPDNVRDFSRDFDKPRIPGTDPGRR